MKFKTIKYKKKEIRIYKWENKPFKNFPMPKGFDWAEFEDFIELYDKDKFKMENYPIEYIMKNISKKDQKKSPLSRLDRIRSGDWNAGWGDLESSDSDGRVVVSK